MSKVINYLWFNEKGFKIEYAPILREIVERTVKALDSGIDVLTIEVHLDELQTKKKA